jgi:protein-S-isoprenylcysteine O-methyltransferase Ste14
MSDLGRRALMGLARFQIALAVMILLPAWSLAYWQGWLYWLLFGACLVTITLYFLRHDPSLVARRMRAGPTAEREPRQKLILTFAVMLMAAIFVLSALDYARGWSRVPTPIVLIADAFVLLGFFVMFLAFRDNSFAAAIVQVDSGQKVVDRGVYARVRHPMYVGAIILFAATPPALGSWWGEIPVALLVAVIAWRLTDEEAYLARNLPGYDAYRRKVTARLMPGVW